MHKNRYQLQYFGSYDENGNLDIDKLKIELSKIKGEVVIQDTETGLSVTVDGYTFEIDGKGNTESKDENQGGEDIPNPPVPPTPSVETIMAKDIANSSNKSEYYGATVNGYTCTNTEGVNSWKIFYADENNIYLIADDYIHYNYMPKAKDGKSLTKGNTNYSAFFSNILSAYSGSSNITDEKIQALNKDYFAKGYSGTHTSMKITAYMLDTSVWSVFAGDKAEYAIGGPTIELLMKSYSEKYNVDYRAQASSSTGYQISKDGGVTWKNIYDSMLNTSDSLYTISSTQRTSAMWIA